MKKMGIYLKQLREGVGLSIRKVSRNSRISPSHLSKIESGSFSTISIQTLLRLSEAYNLPPISILKEASLVDSDEYELPDLAQYL
ncbi:helix-turn-helix domain-containing protein, partial [Patescibacteria group bacterium]|nr:helix-turn-helix domain-containing protein [Patescibacteria group bacterium]